MKESIEYFAEFTQKPLVVSSCKFSLNKHIWVHNLEL